MRYTKGVLGITLALGILFCSAYQAESETTLPSQIVNLTGSSTLSGDLSSGFIMPLSSLKRINPDGSLTDFIVPDKYFFIVSSIFLDFLISASNSGTTPPNSFKVDFSMGNFFSYSTSAFMVTNSPILYKATGAMGGPMVIAPQSWNSNAIKIKIDNSAYPWFGIPKVQTTVSGYFHLRM